jgi:hypothetical protein
MDSSISKLIGKLGVSTKNGDSSIGKLRVSTKNGYSSIVNELEN